jgi:hypothetical protein
VNQELDVQVQHDRWSSLLALGLAGTIWHTMTARTPSYHWARTLLATVRMTQQGMTRSSKSSLLLFCTAVAMTGCPTDDVEPVACEPLETTEVPLTLGHVTAVGKAVDGTLYVVDDNPEAEGNHRLYVSEGLALVRHEVAGTGETNEGDVQRLTLSAGGSEPFTLFVELHGTPTRMKVVDGPLRDKNLDVSAQPGDELEVSDASVLAGLRVRNLEGTVFVEYSARLEGKQRLIVTRPEHDWSYDDFRVFFGSAERLEERSVISVIRARDGGSTWIKFRVGAESAEAFFPTRLSVPGGPTNDEPDTLTVGSKSLTIERLPMDAPELDGLSFACIP